MTIEYRPCSSNSCSSKSLVPRNVFPVIGTLTLVLNMGSSLGSRSRYTFEKYFFNQQHVSLNFARALCGVFSKNHNYFLLSRISNILPCIYRQDMKYSNCEVLFYLSKSEIF